MKGYLDFENDVLLVRCEVCGDLVPWPEGISLCEDGSEVCDMCAGLEADPIVVSADAVDAIVKCHSRFCLTGGGHGV